MTHRVQHSIPPSIHYPLDGDGMGATDDVHADGQADGAGSCSGSVLFMVTPMKGSWASASSSFSIKKATAVGTHLT